ncbi:hypothetical protein EPJ70_02065 [Brachyspira aalborgi]|uniref:Uncharacterized protein n=1 Tax=Brachyspira aalborgi TaxID=29522 RepID=A0A5C8F8Z5_9SPIR|nr:hypothetical protein EPJ70_02065 [Brachyspira aalborgi]
MILKLLFNTLVTVNRQPSTVNRQPSTVNRQPSTYYYDLKIFFYIARFFDFVFIVRFINLNYRNISAVFGGSNGLR